MQTEAFDWPDELFRERIPHVPDAADAAAVCFPRPMLRRTKRPLIVAGEGGLRIPEATEGLKTVRRGLRDPGRADPGGQGLACLTMTLVRRRRRRHRNDRGARLAPAVPTWLLASERPVRLHNNRLRAAFAGQGVRFINSTSLVRRRQAVRRGRRGRREAALDALRH